MNAIGTGCPVISGLGVVSPNGIGTVEQWKATLSQESGIAPLPKEIAGNSGLRIGGIVRDFDDRKFVPDRLRVQTDRWTWLCLAATQFCLDDAEVDLAGSDPDLFSVMTSSSTGGNVFGQRELQSLWANGPATVSAFQSIAWFYAATAGQLSIHYGFKGRCGVTVADGAGGLAAAAAALRLLNREPDQRVLLAGGEAPFSPYGMVCHQKRKDLSRSSSLGSVYRPFATNGTGGVIGEGATTLLLETPHSARARNAPTVYAELAAVACTHDAHHQTDPPPTPAALCAAITMSLHRAGVLAENVDLILTDANGAPAWDQLEITALRQVFGHRLGQIPIAVPKTLTGRLNSGAALLDLAWAAQAVYHDVIPPSAPGCAVRRPGLDVVVEPRFEARLSTVLVIARGVGGFNAAAVLRSTKQVYR